MDNNIFFFFVPLIALGLFLVRQMLFLRQGRGRNDVGGQEKGPSPRDPYQDIEPLSDFDWSTTPPARIRPFKPRYHLTMALETLPLSQLLEVDNTYFDRMQLRKSLMDEHPDTTCQCNSACEPAVLELYEWVFGVYLPRRFPTMYRIVSPDQMPPDSKTDGPCLHNMVADKYIPLHTLSAMDALYTLGEHVDTDILMLLPSSTAADGSPVYHLEAFVVCFPSGFVTGEKLGMPLATIHGPVPNFQSKLEKSMDRFFAKLELGKLVKRTNWTVTTNTLLYSAAGTHLYRDGQGAPPAGENAKIMAVESPDLEEIIEQQKKDVVLDNCRLRCERQTLFRLPKTKAQAFMFKTYQYRLEDVKAEGSGPALADAISGFDKGNSPEMKFYKRGVIWGDKVAEYMRT